MEIILFFFNSSNISGISLPFFFFSLLFFSSLLFFVPCRAVSRVQSTDCHHSSLGLGRDTGSLLFHWSVCPRSGWKSNRCTCKVCLSRAVFRLRCCQKKKCSVNYEKFDFSDTFWNDTEKLTRPFFSLNERGITFPQISSFTSLKSVFNLVYLPFLSTEPRGRSARLQSRCVMQSGRGAQSPPSHAGHSRVRRLSTVYTVKSINPNKPVNVTLSFWKYVSCWKGAKRLATQCDNFIFFQ